MRGGNGICEHGEPRRTWHWDEAPRGALKGPHQATMGPSCRPVDTWWIPATQTTEEGLGVRVNMSLQADAAACKDQRFGQHQ